MELIGRQICYHEPDETCAAYENVYYVSASGTDMIRIRSLEIRDDIYDHCTVSRSTDNGQTWSAPEPYQVSWKKEGGVERRSFGSPFVDPDNGLLLVFASNSFHPTDHMLEAQTTAYQTYRVSEDGGKTWIVDEQIIQTVGEGEYTAKHPIDGLWVGKNAIHLSNYPCRASNGKLIVPMQMNRIGPDGRLFCPPGALSFHDVVILIGTWRDDGRVDWELSQRIENPPHLSTRGAIEAATTEMPDGRMLMVLRGSNAGNLDLPGRKWYCVSEDMGHTWTKPEPWSYTDGSLFYSPSSFSSILRHSNGKYYWIGNICPSNPTGNRPRYPVVIGEVDPVSMLLIKDTLTTIDTRQKSDDHEPLMGNWGNYEERGTGHIVMRMTRLWVAKGGVMRGHSYLYRLRP
ncbi:MAG: sialidase family protein [Planctomycetota bacterium]|nr:sialidase family protein [Planctomycetota bacterium]